MWLNARFHIFIAWKLEEESSGDFREKRKLNVSCRCTENEWSAVAKTKHIQSGTVVRTEIVSPGQNQKLDGQIT